MKTLSGFMNKRIMLFCNNYIYVGKVTKVSKSFLVLEEASQVFETGSFDSSEIKWKNYIEGSLVVNVRAIESIMLSNKV